MTVKELKEKLESIPDNTPVYLEYVDELGFQKELLCEALLISDTRRKQNLYLVLS